MLAVTKRELRSFFASPIGYVFTAVIVALYGFYYYQVLLNGSTDYISNAYTSMFTYAMMILPILTMKSFSEDLKNKTDQALLTAPVGVTSIVVGKFLAAMTVYLIALSISLVPVILMSLFSTPPWGIVLGNYFASLFYGAAVISIGIYISSHTTNQIVAAIGTFVASMFLVLIDTISYAISWSFLRTLCTWLSFTSRYNTFANGIFSVPNAIYFLSIAAAFIFFTARKLESRRWN